MLVSGGPFFLLTFQIIHGAVTEMTASYNIILVSDPQ